MNEEKRFLMDVGLKNLPFPMKVLSKVDPNGQNTVANISVEARIMDDFEARWIDTFIRILHQHRDTIGTKTLRTNIVDYLKDLKASSVKINFDYPFFVEKLTPTSREKCLVRYLCTYSAKHGVASRPNVRLIMDIPVITTYPASDIDKPGGLFGQLSVVSLEVESQKDLFPEDFVDLVDRHSLVPVYSFLTEADQNFIIEKIHSEKKTSVVMIDEIKTELAHNEDIEYYAVRCSNYGMLHSYSTLLMTEKSSWVPMSGYFDEEI
ncbi:GTP cyclohydrolase, FolE2/MptA family [candidate division CSSED10-310 bacterium]|uniref:GTP cyclohydrolase, FolE2/MptA family n=1 Tax=candidate division CSSED10-310 bacterium TaxID=2855610 RepID=A0ABV6YZA3_UNCC1